MYLSTTTTHTTLHTIAPAVMPSGLTALAVSVATGMPHPTARSPGDHFNFSTCRPGGVGWICAWNIVGVFGIVLILALVGVLVWCMVWCAGRRKRMAMDRERARRSCRWPRERL